jgi:hypothetical protein
MSFRGRGNRFELVRDLVREREDEHGPYWECAEEYGVRFTRTQALASCLAYRMGCEDADSGARYWVREVERAGVSFDRVQVQRLARRVARAAGRPHAPRVRDPFPNLTEIPGRCPPRRVCVCGDPVGPGCFCSRSLPAYYVPDESGEQPF